MAEVSTLHICDSSSQAIGAQVMNFSLSEWALGLCVMTASEITRKHEGYIQAESLDIVKYIT